jgi:SAM-dependent methyltransferase
MARWIIDSPRFVVGRVLDVGCGDGVLLARLRSQGWDCKGLDASADMVRAARRRVGRTRISIGDARRLGRVGPVGLVTALGDVVNHLGSTRALQAFLRGARKALQPGGYLVLDTLDPRDIEQNWDGYVEYTSRPGWRLVRIGSSAGSGRGVLRYEYFTRGRSDRWRRHEEVHRLRAWPAGELRALLANSGLSAVEWLDGDSLGPTGPSTVRWLIVAQCKGLARRPAGKQPDRVSA